MSSQAIIETLKLLHLTDKKIKLFLPFKTIGKFNVICTYDWTYCGVWITFRNRQLLLIPEEAFHDGNAVFV